VKFYGKKSPRAHKGLGDKMLEGAKRRRSPVQPKGRIWLGKVLVFAAAGAAVGEVLGALVGRVAGSPEIGMSAGCALGAFAGTFLGEGNAVEALLGAVLGGGFAIADYYVVGWGGVHFYHVAKMSVLGPAGVLLGVLIGRVLTPEKTGPTEKEK
jgi:hypothetical protein